MSETTTGKTTTSTTGTAPVASAVESSQPSSSSSAAEKALVNEDPQRRRLFVGNLHPSTSEGDLIKLFQCCGTVLTLNYVWHRDGPLRGRPRGFAFVEMSTADEAQRAMTRLNGQRVRGREIVVAPKETQEEKCAQPWYKELNSLKRKSLQEEETEEGKGEKGEKTSSGTTTNIRGSSDPHRRRENTRPQHAQSVHAQRQQLSNPRLSGEKREHIAASSIEDNIKRLKASLGQS